VVFQVSKQRDINASALVAKGGKGIPNLQLQDTTELASGHYSWVRAPWYNELTLIGLLLISINALVFQVPLLIEPSAVVDRVRYPNLILILLISNIPS
jgi:hypothetical protein